MLGAAQSAEDRLAGRISAWLLALALPVFAVHQALTNPIEEHAYDAATFHVYRAVVFSAARADGWLYPRWADQIEGGLGGPLFSFYPPLAYFALDALHGLGVSHPLAWRWLVALAFFLASTGAFALGRRLFGRAELALASAAAFVYAPYLAQELFERGSPQGLAIALYPWLLALLLDLAETPGRAPLTLAATCWAAILLVHTLAALLVLPLLAIFAVFLALRVGLRALALPAFAFLLGTALAGFYLLPWLLEAGFVQFSRVTLASYARPALNPLSAFELLAPPPFFDAGLGNNTMGQHVGPLTALVLALGPLLAFDHWRRRQLAQLWLTGACSLLGLATIWLQTDQATPVWVALPALDVIQFRWRLLSYLGLSVAILAGAFLWRFPARRASVAAFLLALAFAGLLLPSLYPGWLHRFAEFDRPPSVADVQRRSVAMRLPGLTTFDEFRPRWREESTTLEVAQRVAATPLANLPEGSRIVEFERRTGWLRLTVDTPVAFRAALHLLYYPGWSGFLDGEPIALAPMERTGFMLVEVPAGTHTVELRYDGTPVQRLATLLSVAALVALAVVTLFWRRTAPGRKSLVASPGVPPWMLAVWLGIFALKAFWLDPGTTLLHGSSTCAAVQGVQRQTDVLFGERIRLCGYAITSTELRPGATLRITLYWLLDEPIGQFAASYVHLEGRTINPENNLPLWGQQDKLAPGDHPVTEWQPGRIYRDQYEFRVGTEAPPGEYRLQIGWWQPDSGRQLTATILRPDERLSIGDLGFLLVGGLTVR